MPPLSRPYSNIRPRQVRTNTKAQKHTQTRFQITQGYAPDIQSSHINTDLTIGEEANMG